MIFYLPHGPLDEAILLGCLLLLFSSLKWTLHHIAAATFFERLAIQSSRQAYAKFGSSLWKFTHYLVAALVGLWAMQGQDWIMSPKRYIIGPPIASLSFPIRIYYHVQTALYLIALQELPKEPKMSDRKQMLLHHICTLSLLFVSYLTGYFRFGLIVAVLHDAADPFLELAKLFYYSGHQKMADGLFGLFAVIFGVTRLGLFPWLILRETLSAEATSICAWFFFNGSLLFLLCLHIYWFTLICRIVRDSLQRGFVAGDCREK